MDPRLYTRPASDVKPVHDKQVPRAGARDQVARAFGSNLLVTPLTALLSLTSSVILVRILSAAEYGLYSLAQSAAVSVIAFAEVGMHQALHDVVPRIEGRAPRHVLARLLAAVFAFKTLLLLGFAVAFAMGWPWIAHHIGVDTASGPPWLRWAILGIAVGKAWMLLSSSLLVGGLRHQVVNRIRIAHSLLHPTLVVGGVVFGGLSGLLLMLVATAFIELALYAAAAVRHYARIPAGTESEPPRLFRRFALYAGTAWGGKLTRYFAGLPFWVLTVSAFVGTDRLAHYAVPVDILSRLEAFLIAPIASLIVPVFSLALSSGNASAGGRAYETVCRFVLSVCLPTAGVLLGASPQILGAVYSTRYVGSAWILQALALGVFLDIVLSGPAFAALAAAGASRLALGIRCIALTTPFLYPLAERLAPGRGPVAALVAMNALIGLASIVAVTARLEYRYPTRFAFRLTACVAVPAALSFGVGRALGTDLLALGASLVVYGVAFVAAFRVSGGLEPTDEDLFLRSRLPFAPAVVRLLGGRR